MKAETPIAVFTYRRPDHTRILLESLSKCKRLDECRVTLFCDGPANPEHAPEVERVRRIIHGWAEANGANVVEHNKNLGLAHSIVAGVTMLCRKYGRVIVVEDDLILHPQFLNFMIESLDHYQDDDRVAQVAGYLPVIHPRTARDTFFLPLTTSCGWATWKRAWNLFSWDTKNAMEILEADRSLRKKFNLDGSYPYYDLLLAQNNGEINSWAVLWHWETFMLKKLTLYPFRSLVYVGGFDNLATHTKTHHVPLFYDQSLEYILQGNWRDKITFPEIVQTDFDAYGQLKTLLHRQRHRTVLLQIWRKIKSPITNFHYNK